MIYIDKRSVINKDRLTRVAYALSATVIDKWGPSATHLIHGSVTQQQTSHTAHSLINRTPALITKSLDRKMRVVAPAWLLACYDEKKRMPETLYPYEMESNTRLTSLAAHSARSQQTLAQDENPFGLEPDEFARIESCSEDDDDTTNRDSLANNRRMTDYYHHTSRGENDNDQGGDEIVFDVDSLPHQENPISDNNNNNNNNEGEGGIGDDVSTMSYSLLEMSQAAPIYQQQRACAPTASGTEDQQRDPTPSLHPPSSIERTMQRMADVHEGIQRLQSGRDWTTRAMGTTPNAGNRQNGAYDEHDDILASSVLPDIDPSRFPKRTLGREDRMRIWYGEQSFCLDADLIRSTKQDVVDLTSSATPLSTSKRPKLTTLSTAKKGKPNPW